MIINNDMDQFDLKILKIIQVNNKITSETLAREVGLSSSACQRRINSMRKKKIIEKDVSIISRNKLDRKITIIVQVLSEKEGVENDTQFKNTMFQAPEVMQCYYITGDYDYVLITTFKEMSEYEKFTRKYFLNNPNIKRFNSMVVMNKVKESLAIPVN